MTISTQQSILPYCFLLLLLLLCTSSSSVFCQQIDSLDISSLTDYIDQTISISQQNAENVASKTPTFTFTGTIASNKKLSIRNLNIRSETTTNRDFTVKFDITMSNNSILEINQTEFPSSLYLVIGTTTISDTVYIRLNSVSVRCQDGKSSMDSSVTCTHGSFGSGTVTDSEHKFNSYYAALVEVKPYSTRVSKTMAGSVVISSIDSTFEITDNYGNFGVNASRFSFGIQRHNAAAAASFFAPTAIPNAVGAGTTPQNQQNHPTVLPFVSASFASSTVICMSPDTTVINAFVGCIVLGNSFNQTSKNFENERIFQVGVPVEKMVEENRFNENNNGLAFQQELLVDSVVLSGTTVRGSCPMGRNCGGVVLSQVLFQRIWIEHSSIEIFSCHRDSAGILAWRSSGDNFTSSPPTTFQSLFLQHQQQLRMRPVVQVHPEKFLTATQRAQLAENSSVIIGDGSLNHSTTLRNFSSSFFFLDNISFSLQQNTVSFSSALAQIAAITLCISDVQVFQAKRISGSVTSTNAQHSLVAAAFLARISFFEFSDSISFATRNTAYFRAGRSNSVFNLRFLQMVKNVILSDFENMLAYADGYDQAIVGLFQLELFNNFLLKNWKYASVQTTAQTLDNSVHLAIGKTVEGTSVAIEDSTLNITSNRNGLGWYFDNDLVKNVDEFLMSNFTLHVRTEFAGNIMFCNSTLVNVPRILIQNFNYSGEYIGDLSQVDPTSFGAGFFAFSTTMDFGPAEWKLQNGFGHLKGASTFVFNVMTPKAFNPATYWVPGTRQVGNLWTQNVTGKFEGTRIAAATIHTVGSLGMIEGKEYGMTGGAEISASPVVDAVGGPLAFFNSSFEISAPFINSINILANTKVQKLTLRNTRFPTTSKVVAKLIGVGLLNGAAGVLDVSRGTGGGSETTQDGGVCSTMANGAELFGLEAIRGFYPSDLRPDAIVARGCGQTLSATIPETDTFYIPWKRTRTETNRSFTKTSTKTKSLSLSFSQPGPELEMETPAGASAAATLAGAAGILGASGASVALDGSRAVAIIGLISRCTSYSARSGADAGKSQKQRQREFQDGYLTLKLSFPENLFPFLCFGPERGACVRGAVLSNLIALSLVFIASVYFAKYNLNKFSDTMTETQWLAEPLMKYSKAPMFLGLLFCFLAGPWATQMIVLLSVADLPDSDSVLGIISIFIFVGFPCYGFYQVWIRVNIENESKGVKDIWQCEECVVVFEKDVNSNSGLEEEREAMNKKRKRKRRASSVELDKKKNKNKSNFIRRFFDAVADFLQTEKGKPFFTHFVWVEQDPKQKKDDDSDDTMAREDNSDDQLLNNYFREDYDEDPFSRRLAEYINSKNNKNKSNNSLPTKNNNRGSTQSPLVPPSTANGEVGTMLWNFGSLLNKHVGPHIIEQPLERRTKKQKKQDRHLKYDIHRFGGVSTRRYFYRDLRFRIAPYYAFLSLLWTLTVCIAQGVALSDPERCHSSLVVMCVVNALCFFTDLYLRPFIVPFRNPSIGVAGFFLGTGGSLATFVPNSPENSETHSIAQGFMMTFIVIIVLVACLSFFFNKIVLIAAKGRLLIRRDMMKQMNEAFAAAEDTLMETITVSMQQRKQRAEEDARRIVEDRRRNWRRRELWSGEDYDFDDDDERQYHDDDYYDHYSPPPVPHIHQQEFDRRSRSTPRANYSNRSYDNHSPRGYSDNRDAERFDRGSRNSSRERTKRGRRGGGRENHNYTVGDFGLDLVRGGAEMML